MLGSGAFAHANMVVGQSAALSGPSSALGLEMKRGIEAFFQDKKDIKFSSKDDKYEPSICTTNIEAFLAEGTDAFLGSVGTPTSQVCLPLAQSAQKVYFGAFTGAGFLSDHAKNPYAFSVRASYDHETEKMVELLTKKGLKKVAIFIQDDAYGEVGKAGTLAALKKRNLELVGEGRYKRNTIAIKEGADAILKSGADAIIFVGSYKPTGVAIKYLRTNKFLGPILSVSFVGSEALAAEIKGVTDNVYVTQVVPNPWDASVAIVKEYQEKIKSNFSFTSLEGYISAKIFYEGVRLAGDKAKNGPDLKQALEKLNMDIGGLKASYSPTKHRALDSVFLTKINSDGSFKSLNELE